ncbi:hypothetical protein ABZ135_25105 [Streptomyces sp. NPDC006339]|uniref:hypothetical protein n=1 Tax=Streptomyces sp. NPDC006339 TaxID=3156755 RepID=UPI00339E2FAF
METAERTERGEHAGLAPATGTGRPGPADGGAEDSRERLGELDAQIIELVKRRALEQRRFAAARRAAGRPATELAWENAVVLRYERELRRPGVTLALTLLEMGRS